MWTIFFWHWERNQNNEKWPLIIGVFLLGVRVAASLKFFIKQWVSGNPPRSPWLKQPTEVVVSCYVDGKNMPSRKAIDEDGFSRCWGGGWADLDIGTLGKGPCQLEIGGRYLYDFFFRLRKSKSFVFFWGEFGHKVETSKQLYSWCWWNFNADLERLLHWVIFFWDLKNDMCRYLSRFFPIKLSALVGQVRFLANFKISRLFLLLPRTPTGPA